jgi:hypothetical protein
MGSKLVLLLDSVNNGIASHANGSEIPVPRAPPLEPPIRLLEIYL